MRILLVDNHEDGVYKCRGELIKKLLEDNEVYISIPKGRYTEEFIKWGCKFEDVEIDRRGINPNRENKLIGYYKRLLDRIKPDIVLTYSIKPNAYVGNLCAVKNIPYIANITGLGSAINNGGILCDVSLFLYKTGLRKAKMVFFQNESNRDYMVKNKIVTVNNKVLPGSGVNLEANKLEEYPDENKPITFLTIGRLMKDKGTDELLQAARIIKKEYPEVTFNLIGFYDGDYKEKVDKAIEDGIVNFYGHQDDVHSFINESHAIIHPSYHEGMANALLEASACGRPVLASDIPGCKETFIDKETGLGFKPQDVDDLVRTIKEFIYLPYSEKKQMGIKARKKMEDEFDRKIIIKEYLKSIYDISN